MRAGFYPKLAGTGIYKNRRLYVPYLLTCVGMVMMYYLIYYLSRTPALTNMPGGDAMRTMLDLGRRVVAIFAAIFLFYTNSFLIRRRKKEYGLYNILGMGKWNLVRIQVWESLITAVISIAGGLGCGMLFSKLAELCMIHIMGQDTDFTFFISQDAAISTLQWFLVIFALIFLSSTAQIHVTKPIELLRSENTGEKKPKANWLVAILGLVVLGCAYGITLSIKEPVTALVWFFIAVIMVIAATYLLFISGSVVICRLLQKSRSYYYQTKHFVSVSSMAYRMKRNGAGLASICILSTMVLVMLSSTVTLFVGIEDGLHSRFMRDFLIEMQSPDDAQVAMLEEKVDEVLEVSYVKKQNVMNFTQLGVAGYFSGEEVITDPNKLDSFSFDTYDKLRYLYFVPLEDYNRIMGQSETLESGEVIVYAVNDNFNVDRMDIDVYGELKVKKQVDSFHNDGEALVSAVSSVYLFTPEFDKIDISLEQQRDSAGRQLAYASYYYGFDLDVVGEKQISVYQKLKEVLYGSDSGFTSDILVECLEDSRADVYGLYGGLFFLGIFLGLVFLAATVLIMYYKQLSEGYEDQARFSIMQKVGMTKPEIRQSINSQMLTVFFLPLLAAGIHLVFAFPIIKKLLVLFAITNTKLLIMSFICCYLVFVLLYVIVYYITSRFYYQIVSSNED